MDLINISIVSPVYRADALVQELVAQIDDALKGMDLTYEIILVEDGSPDDSWAEILKVCEKNEKVVGLKLSRNFGQHYAISAGLAKAQGEWVVVMDCDLQDQPCEIPKLLAKAKEGYDIVHGRRSTRRDSWLKRASSKVFYNMLGYLTGTPQDPTIANFGIYHRKVIEAVISMPETIRFFPTMLRWVGFKSTSIDVEHASRPEGKTSYNLKRLLLLSLDICLAYSDKPLRLVISTGLMVSLIGFIFAGYTITKAIQGKIEVLGYPSLIVSIWVLMGLVIFIIGIVGLYIGKIFEGVKRRPSFIVDTIVNDKEQ